MAPLNDSPPSPSPFSSNAGVEQFKEFYEATTKHRKLSWIYALGTCHIKGNFKARPIELVLSTFQAALLLLFNQGLSHRPLLACSLGGSPKLPRIGPHSCRLVHDRPGSFLRLQRKA